LSTAALISLGTLITFGSLCLFGTLSNYGSLVRIGTLHLRGSLQYIGTLKDCGSLQCFGTLVRNGYRNSMSNTIHIGNARTTLTAIATVSARPGPLDPSIAPATGFDFTCN
jgi:hypothetical protein